MEEALLWYWFTNITGIGNVLRGKLLEVFQTPQELWEITEKSLDNLLTTRQKKYFIQSRDQRQIEESYRALEKVQSRFLYPTHPEYPGHLKQYPGYPMSLYYKGRLPNVPLVAIVGTRRPTTYGKQIASYFASALVEAGFGIVSGLADGIDAISHRSALEAGGYTMGILGGGIDTMYPRNNFSLYLEMYEKGAVLSEYNIGVPNHPGLFPERNRIISGISDAVLIVEAAKRSGSLITADQALEQGKDIYVVPGRITDRLSEGCNQLIKQGAQPVFSPEEIIEDLQDKIVRKQSYEKRKKLELSPAEKCLYDYLTYDTPVSATILGNLVHMEINQVLTILLEMELKGYILRNEMQQYVKRL